MAKKIYVYSTLSSPMSYTKYAKGRGDMSRAERNVLIKGGANVADKNFVTPRGVVTEISAEDYEFLKENKLFMLHVKNGYITVDEAKVDVEKVVADMETRDNSAPLVPEDFVAEGKAPPVTTAAPAKTSAKSRGKR